MAHRDITPEDARRHEETFRDWLQLIVGYHALTFVPSVRLAARRRLNDAQRRFDDLKREIPWSIRRRIYISLDDQIKLVLRQIDPLKLRVSAS